VKYASAFICFPGGYGTLDEFFETITLIQTLKSEAFPVLLYGSEYWDGLVDWMRRQLHPKFIDPEDIDIFRLVDTPQEAVKQIRQGIRKRWWRPLDDELEAVATSNGRQRRQAPLAGAKSVNTGEGTRYGSRPQRTSRKHAKPEKKPSQ